MGWMPYLRGRLAPAAINQSVDADLAALLDNEIMAAETGSSLDVAGGSPSVAAVTEGVATSARGDEPLVGVDLPPVAAEAQPVPAVEPESIVTTTGGADINNAATDS